MTLPGPVAFAHHRPSDPLGVNLIKSHGVWPIVNAASSGTYSKSCHGTDVELWLQREG